MIDARYRKLEEIVQLDSEFMRIHQKMLSKTEPILEPVKSYVLYTMARSCISLNGDIAEVGVYKGGTATILCEMAKGKNIFLYDTFEGLPEDELCECVHKKGCFCADISYVQNATQEYDNVTIKKGVFPETFEESDRQFCFVHLDCDIYKSIKSGLEAFYPLMVNGGIILLDDAACPDCPLAFPAFKEFCETIPEKPISIGTTQMFLIKR